MRDFPKVRGMQKSPFKKSLVALVLLCAVGLFGIFAVHVADINVPYLCFSGPAEDVWSIGIYDLELQGQTLKLHPRPGNPIFTASDITDVPTRFVADPFLIQEQGKYHLFFEILGVDNGVIGLATSTDGLRWRYERVVLEEPFHLSYPNVFRWKDEYYLVPESVAVNGVRLYKATNFPVEWRFVKTIIADRPLVDSTVLIYRDTLWLFSSSVDNQNLYLFYAEHPEGPWMEHPGSPIVSGNGRDARPAGNFLYLGDRLIRFSQDSREYGEKYGKAVRGFEIVALSREEYQERPLKNNPILEGSGSGWNSEGMHQISAWPLNGKRWIAAVDGKRRSDQYVFCMGKRIFRIP